jgi:hypothetical protein
MFGKKAARIRELENDLVLLGARYATQVEMMRMAVNIYAAEVEQASKKAQENIKKATS